MKPGEPVPIDIQNAEATIPQRFVPADVSAASIMSQRGVLVDVTSLIDEVTEDGRASFQQCVQRMFDHIAKTVSSIEYSQFVQEVSATLASVQGQHFIFDIEGTLMNDLQNMRDMSERVYFANPWMMAVVCELMENGNQVGFWTAANSESLAKIKQAMIPEMSELPAISREDYEKVVRAFQARNQSQLSDEKVLEIMQSIYPSASSESFLAGTKIFTDDMLSDFSYNPINFLRGSKFPQLFSSPKNGFIVDDDSRFINSATRRGWPENRGIKCINDFSRGNAIEVVHKIALAVEV